MISQVYHTETKGKEQLRLGRKAMNRHPTVLSDVLWPYLQPVRLWCPNFRWVLGSIRRGGGFADFYLLAWALSSC